MHGVVELVALVGVDEDHHHRDRIGHGLEAFGAGARLLLGAAPVGDIDGHPHVSAHPVVFVADGFRAADDPAQLSVAMSRAPFARELAIVLDRMLPALRHPSDVVRMDHADPSLTQDLLDGETHQLFPVAIGVDQPALRVRFEHRDRGARRERAEALFARRQGLGDAFLLRDVGEQRVEALDFSRFVEDRGVGGVHIPGSTRGQGFLALEGDGLARQGHLDVLPHGAVDVRADHVAHRTTAHILVAQAVALSVFAIGEPETQLAVDVTDPRGKPVGDDAEAILAALECVLRLVLGRVIVNEGEELRPRAVHPPGLDRHRDVVTVAVLDFLFHPPGIPPRLDLALHFVVESPPLNRGELAHRPPAQGLDVVADEILKASIHIFDAPVEVGHNDGVDARLEEILVGGMRALERALGTPRLVDVTDRAGKANRVPPCVLATHPPREEPAVAAIFGAQPVLNAVRLAAPQAALNGGAGRLGVFGMHALEDGFGAARGVLLGAAQEFGETR